MPDNSSYSLTLPRPSAPFGLPARIGATLIAAAAAISILTFASRAGEPASVAVRPSAEAGQVAPAQSVAPATQQTSSIASSSAPAPALVNETSSVQSQAPAVQVVQLQPALAAQVSAASASQSAPSAAAAAPAAPQAAVASRPGSRWLSDGFVFVLEGQDWDAGSFTNVEGALDKLPARIRAQLANRALGDVSILVNRDGRSLSGKQPYGGAANFFSTNDGRNELVLFPDQSVLTILHELGHAYNLRRVAAGRYALVLLDPEMQSFMAATGWRVVSTADQVRSARDQLQVQFAYEGAQIWPRLSNNDPLEDFANSFALYFFSAGDLQQKSQERFAWFEANVGR